MGCRILCNLSEITFPTNRHAPPNLSQVPAPVDLFFIGQACGMMAERGDVSDGIRVLICLKGDGWNFLACLPISPTFCGDNDIIIKLYSAG